MSQKSTKIKITNNLPTSQGRRASERSAGVFRGACDSSVRDTVLLYKLVFRSRKAVLLSILLWLCFVTQPFQKVYADEVSTDIVPASAKVEIPPEFTQEVVKSEIISELPENAENHNMTETSKKITVENNSPPVTLEPVIETEKATSSSVLVVAKSANANKVVSGSNVLSNVSTSSSISTLVQSSSTTPKDDEFSGGNNGNISGGGKVLDVSVVASSTEIVHINQSEDISSSSDNTIDESLDETESANNDSDNLDEVSDSVDEIATNDNFISVVESDSQFSFLKSECTRIEDGSFYCQKKDNLVNIKDSLVAAPDADGDLEIYLVRDGERTQITHNKVDDASPYYDEYSKTIVWHRLVNDRYQIISYDTNTGKEEQLTNTDVNNMEPTRHGDYTVWQRWVHDNWEIILYDGTTEKQITDSSRHDIAPHIRGPLIIWNSRSNDGTQSLMTYDIKDRTYTTIADGEGVSVSNPRLMVMYEAMYENGDVVMKGFDVVTGKITPLQSLPQELPTDLPNTDSTGETRALIQSKPAPKQSDIVNNNATSTSGSSTPPILPDSESIQTLDLRATSTVDVDQIEVVFESPTSTIPDLVIPSQSDSDEMSTSSQTL